MLRLEDPLAIFTDVDGTLLDFHTHDVEPARPWLSRLQSHSIPIVLCSSKTRSEMVNLAQSLGLDNQPLIAENGALIHYPAGFSERPAPPLESDYADICSVLTILRTRLNCRFTTFGEVDADMVASWTGLPLRQAQMAREREASEALIWRDDDSKLAAFRQALEQVGLMLLQGGRFWYVLSAKGGIGQAVTIVCSQMCKQAGEKYITLGLGDGPNDISLLDATDLAVVVKGYNNQPIVLRNSSPERVFHTQHYGPEGWAEGLAHFIAGN